MTPQEFKAARERLDLTQSRLAYLLGVKPQTIRRYETAEKNSTWRPIPGPVEIAVAYMLHHGLGIAQVLRNEKGRLPG